MSDIFGYSQNLEWHIEKGTEGVEVSSPRIVIRQPSDATRRPADTG